MIGETLGQYRIDARLGAGGMGVVYRAHDERLHRTVALKLVGEGGRGSTPGERSQLLDEARAASHLSHPNICTVYEVGEIHGRAFIAMEFVEGQALAGIVPGDGLPAETVVRYGTQIAAALSHAHERGVIHRDLKTHNIVISADGNPKILDFGLARRIERGAPEEVTRPLERVEPGGLVGTLSYVAPEVLLGNGADARSDIWSLGVVLYEMSTGSLPFQGRNEFDLTAAILRSPAQPFPPHVPPILRSIILRCLTKDPAQRYQRAGEVRAALEAVQSDTSTVQAREDQRRVFSAAGLAAAGLVLAALALLGWWMLRDRAHQAAPQGNRKLTRIPLNETRTFSPVISADGRMLAYVAETGVGRVDLYAGRVSGGTRLRLTNDDAREETPKFSPDGERLVYTRTEVSGGVPEIRVVRSLGGETQELVRNAADPAWAPDGRRLAYIQRRDDGTGADLAVSSIDASGARVVLRGDSTYPFLRNPSWSPDGKTLAVVRGTGGVAGEIWLVPVDGGLPVQPLDESGSVFADWPTFTADGRGLIHSSNRGGATNVWMQPLPGGAPVQLTTGPGPDEWPSVAADGTVAFLNTRWRNTLEIRDHVSGVSRTLFTHAPYIWGPAISPDEKEIAFSRGEVDGSWQVWTIPVDGGAPRQLTSGDRGAVYPRYAPDGQSIIVNSWLAPRRIARVPRDGGPMSVLQLGAEGGEAYADVSPDGAQVAFTRSDPEAERIYVAPASGGPPRRLTASPGACPRWSPDGSQIAFASNRGYSGGIFVIGADGNGLRRLTTDGGWPVWWPDGQQIGYLTVGSTGQEIRLVSLKDGKTRMLTNIRLTGSNHPFAVFKDGRRLVVDDDEHLTDEVWLLEPNR
jgi:serine/threonine protein kinase